MNIILILSNEQFCTQALKQKLEYQDVEIIRVITIEDYIQQLKSKTPLVSIIFNEQVMELCKDYLRVYELLSLKKKHLEIIVGKNANDALIALDADVMYTNFDLEAISNDIIGAIETYELLLDVEQRASNVFTKNDLTLTMQEDVAIKNRRISTLYTQLTEFQNKTHQLFTEWEELHIPKNRKKIFDFHNHFRMLVVNQKQDWDEFHEHFVLIHPTFFKKIQGDFPTLTLENIKVCAYLKMGMSNKEIASYLNILPNSVKRKLSRIRVKLDLPKEASLRKFILDIE